MSTPAHSRIGPATPLSPDVRSPIVTSPRGTASEIFQRRSSEYMAALNAYNRGTESAAQMTLLRRGMPNGYGGFTPVPIIPRPPQVQPDGTVLQLPITPRHTPWTEPLRDPAVTRPFPEASALHPSDPRHPGYIPNMGSRVPPSVVRDLYAFHNPGSVTASTAGAKGDSAIHFYIGSPKGGRSPDVRSPIVDRAMEARQAEILAQAQAENAARMSGSASSGLRDDLRMFTTSTRAEALSSGIAAADARRSAATAAARDTRPLGVLNARLEEALARYDRGEATQQDMSYMRSVGNRLHQTMFGSGPRARLHNQQESSYYEKLTSIFPNIGAKMRTALKMNHRGERIVG